MQGLATWNEKLGLKRMPKRWALMLAGLIPTAVFTGMLLADLLVIGRQPKVFAAMSPIVIALALPCVTLLASCRKSTTETKKRVAGICLSLVLILAVLWSVLILWEMTDRNFLGAGC